MGSTSFIALGIAVTLVLGMVFGLGVLNLVVGAIDGLLGQPKLKVLNPEEFDNGFAFALNWSAAKEPANIDTIEIRLFNPLGKPTQVQVKKSFDAKSSSFVKEVNMGHEYKNLLGAEKFESGRVQVELSSSKDGVNFQFEYPASKFKGLILNAKDTVKSLEGKTPVERKPVFELPTRSFISDTVPGQGAQLAIETNPAFEAYFKNMGGGGAPGEAVEEKVVENFAVSKVEIIPGCIVCNACEDIYPEVFEVLADTCIVRPNYPMDDGLRVEEAAEACPVEVIKFTKAV